MLIEKIKARINKKSNDRKALLAKTILELDTTVRTYNILRRSGIDTVGDLVELSWNDIKAMRRSNRGTCLEVEALLQGIGLGLREDDR